MRTGNDPILKTWGELKKVVVLGVDAELRTTGQVYESDYSIGNELIGAVPVHGAQRTVILRRAFSPSDIWVFQNHSVPPTASYALTAFPPEGDVVHDFTALNSEWPGRAENARYRFRAIGGRIEGGTDFLLVAQRVVQAPDSLATEIATLSVDATDFTVMRDRPLPSRVVIPSTSPDPYDGLTCTQMAYHEQDGWLIAHKVSGGAGDWIRGYLIDSSLNVIVSRGSGGRYAAAQTGHRLGRFAIAGSRHRLEEGLYALVVEQVATGPAPQITLKSHVIGYRGNSWGTGNTGGQGEQELGPSFGSPQLVQNTGAHSQWMLLDFRYEDTAAPLQIRKLGSTAAAYYREDIARDVRYVPTVTYDHVRDETVFAFASQAAEAVVIGRLPRWEPRGSTAVGGSSGGIGPEFFSSLSNVDDVTFPRVPMPGHLYYKVSLDQPAFHETLQNLRLAVSSRHTIINGRVRPDMSVVGARRIPVRVYPGWPRGRAEVALRLNEIALYGLFEAREPDFSRFGLVRWPRKLYVQFEWENHRADPSGGVRYENVYSGVLEITLGL